MSEEIPDGFKKTEIGVIPEEWEVVKLGDIAEIKYGKSKPKDDGSIPVVGSGGVYSFTNTPLVNFPTIVIGRKGTAGRVWLLLEPCYPSDTSFYLRWKKDVNIHYLFYFMMSHPLSGEHAKTTLPSLQKPDLENFVIPLPPLPEQQKIAHVLSTIQEAKERTEAVIKTAKELKKSLMKYLFTYGPVPLNEAENVKLKETEIGLIPEEWEVVKLGDVLLRTQYGLSKRASDSGKYPMIRMNNMINGRIDVSDLKYIDLDEEEYQKFKVNKGDILFNRTNSIELVGKTSLFDLDLDCVFASYIIRLSLDTQRLIPEFLNYYMNIDATQKNLKKLASRGVSQSNISATKLKTFEVPLPPLHIQQKIASILSAVDEKIEKEENKKKALEKLFKSMLRNIMTGKVRVKDLDIEVEKENNGVKMG